MSEGDNAMEEFGVEENMLWLLEQDEDDVMEVRETLPLGRRTRLREEGAARRWMKMLWEGG